MKNCRVQGKNRYKLREIKSRDGLLQKIVIMDGSTSIKIEPNFTIRGTLLPVEKMGIHQAVEDRFLYSVKNIPVLSEAELYAGKICAALSRQHGVLCPAPANVPSV